MTKTRWYCLAVADFLIVTIAIIFLVKINLDKRVSPRYEDRGLPVIAINLNGVEIETIDAGSKETKYEGNTLEIYNGDLVGKFGDVEVKGRGNGTWVQEKKPYQIKFDEKVDLFGMGRARKWYLLANSVDPTNLRTETAFYLEGLLGMECVFGGQFVELYVDGDYRGLYYLTRAVEIANDLVNLKDPMGLLVELDNIYGNAEKNYKTKNGDKLVVKDIVNDNMVEEAMMGFLQDYNEFEIAVAEKNYEKISELVDVESFAQYYLLSEFTVNPDAYWTSFYMYKDGINDKIHAGPGWDFDLAFGNVRWGNWIGEEFYSPTETMIRKKELMSKELFERMGLINDERDWYDISLYLSRIIFDLMEIPEFQEEVRGIFQERMSGRVEELVMVVERGRNRINKAAIINEEKWGENGLEEEINKMLDWIRQRYDYFEQEYGNGVIIRRAT